MSGLLYYRYLRLESPLINSYIKMIITTIFLKFKKMNCYVPHMDYVISDTEILKFLIFTTEINCHKGFNLQRILFLRNSLLCFLIEKHIKT